MYPFSVSRLYHDMSFLISVVYTLSRSKLGSILARYSRSVFSLSFVVTDALAPFSSCCMDRNTWFRGTSSWSVNMAMSPSDMIFSWL